MIRCAVLTLLDVIDRFRGRNPGSSLDVVDRGLDSLGIVLRKEPKMFSTDFDFRPDAISQHKESVLTEYYEAFGRHKAAFLVRRSYFVNDPIIQLN
jgi:hypothetical protein